MQVFIYFHYLMLGFFLYYEACEETISRVRYVINAQQKKKVVQWKDEEAVQAGTKCLWNCHVDFSGAVGVDPLSPRKMLWFRCHLVLSLGLLWGSKSFKWILKLASVWKTLWGSESQAFNLLGERVRQWVKDRDWKQPKEVGEYYLCKLELGLAAY